MARETTALQSYPLHGGCVGQGQLARANGEAKASHPWQHNPAAAREWLEGWEMEDNARKDQRP